MCILKCFSMELALASYLERRSMFKRGLGLDFRPKSFTQKPSFDHVDFRFSMFGPISKDPGLLQGGGLLLGGDLPYK